MKVVKRAVLRGLVPACTVAAVLGLSYLGPLPVDTSSAVGYAYNCGVKGNGYHDHGKVCPNRPFPGHGMGLEKFAITVRAGLGVTTTSAGQGKNPSEINDTDSSLDNDDTQSITNGDTASLGKGHSKHHGRGRGVGHL